MKLKVGVFRTQFPLYPETFIGEQIRNYSEFEAIVITRDLVSDVAPLPVITLKKTWRPLRKMAFTGLGLCGGFDNPAQQKKLSLIHAHFAPDAALVLPLAEKLKIPLVVTCHGSDVTVADKHIAKSMKLSGFRYLIGKKRLIKRTSLFIAVSDFLRNRMIEVGFPENKVVRHYIGIDPTKFVPRAPSQPARYESPYILSIARHTDVKGLDLLLRAFAVVVAKHPALRLVQIGGGDLTEQLKNLSRDLMIENSVDFIGPLPSEKVLPFIQECAALVLSSRRSANGAEEAFGLVLAEASSCGVPCIGTRVGGIPEAVIDGETGFLVEPENVAELAEKMEILVSNPALSAKMGLRGRDMVCEHFNLQKQTRLLEALYLQIL